MPRGTKKALKGQCHAIFDFWLFYGSVFPEHLSIQPRPFQIFSKIRGDIRGSRYTTGVNDTGGKWKKSSSRKILIILFGHLQVYLKVSAAWYCFHYLPPVSTTPVTNLPPVLLIPVAICHRCRWHRRQICRQYCWHRWQICHCCQQHKGNWWQNLRRCHWYPWQICRRCRWYRRQFATGVIETGGKFATGVVDTGGAPWLANISANFRKNSKWS